MQTSATATAYTYLCDGQREYVKSKSGKQGNVARQFCESEGGLVLAKFDSAERYYDFVDFAGILRKVALNN